MITRDIKLKQHKQERTDEDISKAKAEIKLARYNYRKQETIK